MLKRFILNNLTFVIFFVKIRQQESDFRLIFFTIFEDKLICERCKT